MGFTPITFNNTVSGGSSSTVAVTPAGSVSAGDFVFVHVVGDGIPTISVSDGTSSLSPLGQILRSDNGSVMQGFYLFSSVATGSVTYTATFSFATTNRAIVVGVYTPTGAVTFDQGAAAETTGTSSGNSGNVTTIGSDDLALGYSLAQDGGTASSMLLNSLSAANSNGSGGVYIWSRAFASPFTGEAAFTNSGTASFIMTGIATFKIATTPTTDILHAASWM
jgi:hypothetical protein